MDFLLIVLLSAAASVFTFISNFGFGTALVPIYGIFFPLPLAVMMTAVVQLLISLRSLCRMRHLRKLIDWNFLKYFGSLAVMGAMMGAWLLSKVVKIEPLLSYQLGGHIHTITVVKITIATLLLCFIFWERTPQFRNVGIPQKWVWFGALSCGFLGGFAGQQEALQSTSIKDRKLDEESLGVTSAGITVITDLVRLFFYLLFFSRDLRLEQPHWIVAGVVGSVAPIALAQRQLKDVSKKKLEPWITAALILLAFAFGSGLVGQ